MKQRRRRISMLDNFFNLDNPEVGNQRTLAEGLKTNIFVGSGFGA